MQVSVVLFFALVAATSAGIIIPETYSYNLGLTSPALAPLAYPAHIAYSAPLMYSAPYIAPAVVAAPAIKSGYVAATPGAVHTAPLPEGPHAFSHHLNTAPAPGTL